VAATGWGSVSKLLLVFYARHHLTWSWICRTCSKRQSLLDGNVRTSI